MDKRSMRGRGRGRDYNSTRKEQASGRGRGLQWRQVSRTREVGAFENNADERFNKTREKHSKAAEQAIKSSHTGYESSSDEDDLDDEGILSKLTNFYKGNRTGSGDELILSHDEISLGKTTQYLTECCQSGALTCLVCISSIKRQESIWDCKACFAIFHLNCIKQWVLEGVAQATLLSDEYFPNKEQPWYCPKCRNEYPKQECPKTYRCFCGSEEDPHPDPWLLPHSCGSKCNKLLENPTCGHKCLLLCHPGPCPPCPQTVKLSCHCGKQAAKTRRCGSGNWSCGEVCNKLLACRKHRCQMVCHSGECTTCSKSSLQPCVCGSGKRIQPCVQPVWNCDKKCDKPFRCGFHKCEKVCHEAGQCGECPRSGERTCPCGKVSYVDLLCTEDTTPCEDTCGKDLGCFGNHKCSRRCHFGPCGSCPLMAKKPCRCGKREKEVPCQKEYTCETRCQKIRRCGNHQCRRKCCTGDCPPCEQPCGRTLQCKKHKCQMVCHQGPCYPCPLTSKVTCRCGSSVITVVCGKEKATKPPRCRKLCQIPPDCHHAARVRHVCHFGDCPPCKQTCLGKLSCGHTCPAPCHDNVLVKSETKAAAPWELPRSDFRVEKLPCPPCKIPVGVVCRGGHETGTFPCSESRDYSCGRQCGRLLKCKNHKCQLICHVVDDADVDDGHAGSNCAVCEEPCSKPRPEGCAHDCVTSCHDGECPPCHKRIRMKCHCGGVPLKHLCSDWTSRSLEERNRMTSCGTNCPRTLTPCGHMCPQTCHPGPCPPSTACPKRVTLRCPCKRRKREFLCSLLQTEKHAVQCDDVCLEIKAARIAEREAAERKKKEDEEKRQLEEVEKFERKLHRRSRLRKRGSSQDVGANTGIWSRLKDSWLCSALQVVVGVAMVISAIAFAYLQTEV
uniref:ZF(NFX1) NF-X1-type zinc finger protein n=1 Tax=Phallusia mammillata TaxID=59560 RepID=A0A6F9DLJ2_9ASCI|nr:ZF(NFX1) NF-X1-type zinc finger protein [Phallusia mammillata]